MVDAVDVPKRAPRDAVHLGDCLTKEGGEDDQFVAIGRNGNTEWDTTVVVGWRFNRETRKIEPSSGSGLRCRNTEFRGD